MNRVTCRECGEVALHSVELAERLEGQLARCPHCDSVGRIVLRESDDDANTLAAIELVAVPEATP